MIDCKTSTALIDQYLDGTITDIALDDIKAHTDSCEPCRRAFERAKLMQIAISEAFASKTAPEHAAAIVTERISASSMTAATIRLWPGAVRKAAASVILLAAGLLIGYVAAIDNSADVTTTARLAISAADIEGTVLVRHADSDIWRVLDFKSPVHLGDTFQSVAGGRFALRLEGQSSIKVDQNSMLIVKQYDYDGQTKFHLEHGRCTAILNSPHGPFFIETPHTRATALGTEFTVTVE